MIDFLREWIEQIAVAVIIASIFEMILPDGKTKKYIKMILGVFIVFNMISPFVNGSTLYNFDVNDIVGNYMGEIKVNDTESSIDNKVEELYIEELERDIVKNIEEQGYIVDSCDIEAVVYSDKDEAGISKINITILSKNDNGTEESEHLEVSDIEEVEIEVNIDNTTKNQENNSITEKDIKKLKKHLSDYYEIDKDIININ